MDEMTKKLKRLEKETAQWKQRWEKSNATLLEMATEKKQRDADLINASKQISQLEKLCRALQAERTGLLSQIKGSATSSSTTTSPDHEQDESSKLSTLTSNDTDSSSARSPSAENNPKSETPQQVDEKQQEECPGTVNAAAVVESAEVNSAVEEVLIHEAAKMGIEDAIETNASVARESTNSEQMDIN